MKNNECKMRYRCVFAKYNNGIKTCKVQGELKEYNFKRQTRQILKPQPKVYYKDLTSI